MCHLTALVDQPLGEEILCDRDTVQFLSCAPFAMAWGCLGRVQHPHLGTNPHHEKHPLHLCFTVHAAAPTTSAPLPDTSTPPPHTTTSPAPGTSTGTVVSHPCFLLAVKSALTSCTSTRLAILTWPRACQGCRCALWDTRKGGPTLTVETLLSFLHHLQLPQQTAISPAHSTMTSVSGSRQITAALTG